MFVTMLFGILVVCCQTAFAAPATFAEKDSSITVKLATDKESYKEGETISYSLIIENGREYWRIKEIKITDDLPDGFLYVEGSEHSFSDMLESGETLELKGGITNSGNTSFAQLDTSKIKWKLEGEAADEAANDGINPVVFVVIAIVVVLILVLFICFRKKGIAKKAGAIFLGMSLLGGLLTNGSMQAEASYANPVIVIRPYVTINYAGEEITLRYIVRMELGQEKATIDAEYRSAVNKICCHDPSIFRDSDGKYYVIGSFLATGSSENLNDWKSNDAAFQNTFSAEVREKIKAWNDDDSAGSWNGYLWAPDIIYNTSMNKYCIYLSANGDFWKSNIVLLTADSVYGPYDYAGTIVYGGFNADTIGETDALDVLGVDTIPDRYVTNGVDNRKWGDMFPNCIDPCVFYDEEGNLWMSYGSWSGGIFMLALDEETGLRDYNVTYETDKHSDAYFGTKIAGGAYVSGEASYIQHIGDYYYLFISYGNLEAKGGYNIRIFRSTRPDGDYVDELGNSPYFDYYAMNYNSNIGDRIFGGYKWRTMTNGEVAQGHNSAFVDEDGKAYIVFHTRTTDGSEGHYVKVHQLFVNKEGWLVAAPYMTDGESLKENGVTVKDVAGKYEMIIHNIDIDYKNLDVNKSCVINLNENGTITGEYSGTWSVDEGTSYISLNFNDVTYSGVALEMYIENSTLSTYVFTALGIDNQINIWGSRVVE